MWNFRTVFTSDIFSHYNKYIAKVLLHYYIYKSVIYFI
nr:MAG TPA: hypothetical protein [Caudoviricetes sp.]